MRHLYRMYKYTKFVQEKMTYAENHRDENDHIPYPGHDDLIKTYAKLKKIRESEVAHLQSSCIENGYLWKHKYNDRVFVDDGKGAKLLDSFLSIRVGLIEETLEQYHSTVAFFFGAAFIGVLAFLWDFGGNAIHQIWPHITDFFKYHL